MRSRPSWTAECDDLARFAPAPLYERIKRLISERITLGHWQPEERIPSENELVRDLLVSRMTVHRALQELTREGLLMRIQGVGTFVAPAKPEYSIFEIRNIAEEIAERRHEHSCEVRMAREELATPRTAEALTVPPGAPVFHTICVHYDNGIAVQMEDRYVNPQAAPDYLAQDFTKITPTLFLTRVITATDVKHVIEAISADEETARCLDIGRDEPCLRMIRTTWANKLPVTHVVLTHPGRRYRLSGVFSPAKA
ncbi:histidine utilization repressor [Tianweitania sediminis]|uniref:Histidine utilization repressor n=1 Tax=Tianweitania sediminis TaxID=1502156 RepID=A0A8J7UJH1_9HYPH|nr:histidine utilization repressor [Tianweitania sediminis]MBP0437362.1 histidine utilization repressor [Tianweitania sediminis]